MENAARIVAKARDTLKLIGDTVEAYVTAPSLDGFRGDLDTKFSTLKGQDKVIRAVHELVRLFELAVASAPVPAPVPVPVSRRRVEEALAEDKACRRIGVTDGLYTLSDLAPFKRAYAGDIPVLFAPQRPSARFNRAATDTEFATRISQTIPVLDGFDLKAHGLVIAGGAVSALLMRYDPDGHGGFSDVDFFLVGHTSEASATRAIRALGEHLAYRLAHRSERPPTVYRTPNCVTFYAGKYPMQVILRNYSTEGEVVHGFDLGSSAFVWDGARVRTTALGKLAAENGVNVLNLTARRASYESRIVRYFSRGFDLVLPNLDTDKVKKDIRLPFLSVCGHSPNDDKTVDVSAIRIVTPVDASAYDYAGGIQYLDLDLLDRDNAVALSKGKAHLCAHAAYTEDLDVCAIEPMIGVGPAAVRGHIPFRIMDVVDGTALTGPFVRAPTSAAEWYGEYYRA